MIGYESQSRRRHDTGIGSSLSSNESGFDGDTWQSSRPRSRGSARKGPCCRNDTSSGHDSLTMGHNGSESEAQVKTRRARSPPPSYESLYVKLPNDTFGSDSDSQYSSSEDETVPQSQLRGKRRSNRSQSYIRNNNEKAYRSRSKSLHDWSQYPHPRTPIYEENANSDCDAPDYLIMENSPSRPSERTIEVGDRAYHYQTLPVPSRIEAKDLLVKYAKNKTRCGTKAAKNCEIVSVRPSRVYRYQLLTLTEDRRIERKTTPYDGTKVDGPQMGKPPQIWSIPVREPEIFRDDCHRERLPHTSLARKCYLCNGSGNEQCEKCSGNKTNQCHLCHGNGYDSYGQYNHRHETCSNCYGEGKLKCSCCSGKGTKQCTGCDGKKKVLEYSQLVVTWKRHESFHVQKNKQVPKELLQNAGGKRVLKNEGEYLEKISSTQLLNKEIREASERHLARHNWSNLKKLKQRQVVRLIPINEVHYFYDAKLYNFFLVGMDRRVYAPRYPHSRFWGCCVM